MALSPRRPDRFAWLGLAVALLFAGGARAQTGSALVGAVTEARTGKPVVGATVQVEGPAIEERQTVLSEAGGLYTIPDLPAGTYALSVAMSGYEPYRRAGLVLKENVTLRANVSLAAAGGEVDEVVVTGSRIRRKDLTTPAPVTVIEREEIEESGVVGLGEFLQTLPSQGNALNARANRGNDGQVRVNLRSLDSRRTLVLVNGRRMVSGSTGETVVDLDSIPLAAVERVEVLKDGGSPIYGSEAIAGVVNVILKDRFEGTQLSALGGVSSRGDAQSVDLSLSTGITGERGSALFSAGWQEQRPIMGNARGWAAQPLSYDFEHGAVVPGGSFYTGNGALSIWDESVCAGDPGAMTPALRAACEDIAGGGENLFVYDPETGAYRPWSPDDTYNFQDDFYLLTPARRLQVFSAGNYQLLPAVRTFYEASFVNRRSSTLNPPDLVDVLVSGQSLSNELRTDLLLSRRLMEFGRRVFHTEQNTFRIVAGLDGALGAWAGPLRDWRWELSYLFGRNSSHARLEGLVRGPALDAAVGPSHLDGGVPTCGTPGAPIGDCVPIDLLHGVGAVTPEQRRRIGFTGMDDGVNELQVLSFTSSGALFSLWADRPASLAAGVDYRRESGGYFPDPVTSSGESTGGSQQAVSGRYATAEWFAELSLPLVSGRPVLHDVELLAALRMARYSTFGAHTTYKLGARWAPVRDVTLRGTWSTAFRAPDVLELYQGGSDAYPTASDPCATPGASPLCPAEVGGTDESIRTLRGGNTELEPETARILTAGVVFQPRWVRDLSLTVDYWDIDLENTVDLIGTQVILNGCYTADPADSDAAYCARVHRDPVTGAIEFVDDRLGNIGGTRTSGVDVAARWRVPARSLGTIELGVDASYLLRFDKTFSDGSVTEAAGTYGLSPLVLPRWRWNAGLGWQRGGLAASTTARYVGSYEECGDGLCVETPRRTRRVSANLVFDAAASYQLRTGAGTTALQAGVRNVFDSPPPMVFTAADNNTDPTYDSAGRYFWGRVVQTF